MKGLYDCFTLLNHTLRLNFFKKIKKPPGSTQEEFTQSELGNMQRLLLLLFFFTVGGCFPASPSRKRLQCTSVEGGGERGKASYKNGAWLLPQRKREPGPKASGPVWLFKAGGTQQGLVVLP